MANINIKLTLLTATVNSGPLYNAYYTIDNITYTIAVNGSNLSLPSVGSQVIITIPDNSTNVKLVNLTAGCQDNYYIVPVVTTTTTSTSTSTTTSTSTSTTTTSTTSTTTSTTSTTTTLAPVYYYNATRCHDGVNEIIYGGNSYYNVSTVVISGITSYCYTIQNEVIPQAYNDTVGASVGGCGAAPCYVIPTTTTTTTTCNPTPNWQNTGFSCYSTCNKYNVETDQNPCSPTYNTTRQGSLVESNSTYCGGCCGQSTAANWVNNGAQFCSGCTLYQPERDNNTCSPTYNQTRNVSLGISNNCGSWNISYYCQGCAYYSKETNSCTGDIRNVTLISSSSNNCGTWNISYYCTGCAYYSKETNSCTGDIQNVTLINGNSTNCGGCCGQSTAATWVNTGSYSCYSTCNKYNVEQDNNICSPTYGQTQQGTLVESNSTFCGGCCGVSPSANWVNNGSTFCTGCTLYQPQIDNNVCSSTYGNTRNVNLGINNSCGSWPTSYYCIGCAYYSHEVNSCTGNVRNTILISSDSTSCGGCCGQSTAATWTNEGSAYCDNCVSKQLQRDTNPCSSTYNQTRVINSGSGCNTSANWVNSGSYNCYSTCNKYNVEVDNNPCSSTYNQTRQGSVVEYNSTFCGGCCGQSTSPSWTNEGSAYCDNCVSKQLQRDTNPCSATYNQTRVINSGTACNYTANWVNSGSYDCYGSCTKYNIEIDNNPCSSTYNQTRQGSVVEYNSTFCGGCCGQSTSPNWVNNGSTFCDGCNLQQPQIDSNPCSATYGDTRNVDLGVTNACGVWVQSFYCVGYDKWSKETNTCTGNVQNQFLVEVNSPYCGYVPPPTCRTYQIVGYNADEYVDGVYTNCGGGSDSFSFYGGPGTVGYICAQISTVYVTSGNGAANDVGGC